VDDHLGRDPLSHQFTDSSCNRHRAECGGCAEWDDDRLAPDGSTGRRYPVHGGRTFFAGRYIRDARTEHRNQQGITGWMLRPGPVYDEMALQAEVRRHGCGCATMVGLDTATGNEGVGAGGTCFRRDEHELPHLVATIPEGDLVIALGEKRSLETDGTTETGKFVDR
jgi:hypothetical protein